MSAETIAAIEKAVREHFAEIMVGVDTAPVVTSWVVAVEVQTLEGGEIRWDNGYATSETASPNTTTGLAMWLGDEMRELKCSWADDEDEDDDDDRQ